MDSLTALIAGAARRVWHQKSANALAVFLPLGAAAYFLGVGLIHAFGLPAWIPTGLAATVLGGLVFALRAAHRGTQTHTIAAFLDEKTGGQERFLTYVSLPDVSPSESSASDVHAHLRVQAARKAVLFVPKRDLPFRLDRRVPLTCAAAVLSGLLFGFVSGDEASGRGTGGPPADVEIPPLDALVRSLEQTAHTLTRSASATRTERDTDAAEKRWAERQQVGAALRELVRQLESSSLMPQQKQRAIEETQKRLNLPVSLPQVLPIDLELLGSDNGQDGQPEKRGDDPLADLNQNLERLKQLLSQTSESELGPSTGQTDWNSVTQPESGKTSDPEPKAAGGGIQFDGLPDKPRRERDDRTGNGAPGEQQMSLGDPESRQAAAGVDLRKAGPMSHRQAASHDPTAAPRSGADRRNADRPEQSGRTTGRSSGQGEGERYYEPGERTGGFTTRDVGYVKVRIPASVSTGPGHPQRIDNPDSAVPVTPYSNAPLAEDPRNPDAPQQPIPYEYRAILTQSEEGNTGP